MSQEQMFRQGVGQLGAGMLAASNKNPMQALGMSYLQAQNQGLDNARQTMLAKEFKDKQDERKRGLERENAWKKWVADNKDVFGEYRDYAEHLDPGDALKLLATGEKSDFIEQYEYAKAHGFTGSPADWKTLNNPGTNVTVNNAGDKAWEKKNAEKWVDRYHTYQSDADAASQSIQSLDQAERLLSDPRLYTGLGGETIAPYLQKGAALLGLDPKAAASSEAFAAAANDSVFKDLGGLGNAISNADLLFAKGAFPSLAYTREGNRIIIDFKRRAALRKQQVAELADRYVEEHGELNTGWRQHLREWTEANPLYSAEEQKQIEAMLKGSGGSDEELFQSADEIAKQRQ
jgi:hypothetical protein